VNQAASFEQRDAELNARIDRLTGWGLSPTVFVVVGLSYFFAFYDISAIAFTLPTLTDRFGLTEAQTAYPVSANLLAYAIGAYVLGNVADSRGRRMGLLITVVLLALGGFLTALSWDIWSLTAFRFITGLGTGAEIALAASIMTEFSPSRYRGRYLQINYLWGAAGLATTPFVAIFLLNTFPDIGWRLVFAFGALVAVMLIFMRGRWLPESPRWLILNGREEEAERLVGGMEERLRSKTGRDLPPVPPVHAERKLEGLPTTELFKPPYLGRALVVLGFWFLWYVAVYAFLGYYPTILIERGLDEASGLLYSALSELAIPIGGIIALLLVEVGQRKHYISTVAFVFTAALILASFSTSGFLLWLGGFISSMMIAANAVGYLYTAEIFPTRARATATSVGDGFGHFGGVIAPFIVVSALGALGGTATLWIMAAFVFASGLIILLGGIKTTGERLTELAD
jgi:MFS transporter, putative metabolite:H+ symporter